MNIQNNNEFQTFVKEIKEKILSSQYEALKKVKEIVAKQEAYGWGKSVVKNLSDELRKEFVGIKGFSERNLWNMKNFYIEYKDNAKLQTLSAQIGWSHNVAIFRKCKDDLQREFYIKSVIKFGWTYRVLDNQIDNQTYEKYLLNQTNFNKTLPKEYKHQAKFAVKDEYSFDFLELSDNHSEYELEIGLINKIREFLSAMGTDFTFIGNQYKIEIDNEEYFIDLLLYHRRLRTLIAVELKIGKFIPEYAGKMSFYLSVLNDTVKLKDENPSIGIIICKDKKNQPIGVATYKLSKELPTSLKEYLPTPVEIEKNLVEYLKVLNA